MGEKPSKFEIGLFALLLVVFVGIVESDLVNLFGDNFSELSVLYRVGAVSFIASAFAGSVSAMVSRRRYALANGAWFTAMAMLTLGVQGLLVIPYALLIIMLFTLPLIAGLFISSFRRTGWHNIAVYSSFLAGIYFVLTNGNGLLWTVIAALGIFIPSFLYILGGPFGEERQKEPSLT